MPESVCATTITLMDATVVALVTFDVLFFFNCYINVYDYHVTRGDEEGHQTHYRPFIATDDYMPLLLEKNDHFVTERCRC